MITWRTSGAHEIRASLGEIVIASIVKVYHRGTWKIEATSFLPGTKTSVFQEPTIEKAKGRMERELKAWLKRAGLPLPESPQPEEI